MEGCCYVATAKAISIKLNLAFGPTQSCKKEKTKPD